MKRTVIVVALALPYMSSPSAFSIEPRVVPFDDIWGYGMPGTRDVTTLKGAKLLEGIRNELSKSPKGREGFVVQGDGAAALRAASAALLDKKPQQSYPESELTLVFFSYEFGYYVRLEKVEIEENVVKVHYQFVPHKSKELTKHFALIPLGQFSPGKVQVEFIQSPLPQEFANAGWKPVSSETAQRVVCQSFSFVVK